MLENIFIIKSYITKQMKKKSLIIKAFKSLFTKNKMSHLQLSFSTFNILVHCIAIYFGSCIVNLLVIAHNDIQYLLSRKCSSAHNKDYVHLDTKYLQHSSPILHSRNLQYRISKFSQLNLRNLTRF